MSDNNTKLDKMNNTDDDLEEKNINSSSSSTTNEMTSDLPHCDSGLGSLLDSMSRNLSAQSSFSDLSEDVSQPPEEANVSRPMELDSYNNPTLAEVLLLELAMHRFFTFPKDWNQAVPKLDLANSGFFFNHAQDAIQCFFCKVKISGYMNTSDVNTKHRELCPSCPLMTSAPSCSNIPIGDVTSYRYEANRLFSLFTTNWTAPIDVYDLAKSGFYWTGTSDNCRCVFCRLEVRGWETGDTADGEHRRWNSSCVFLNGRTVGNVPIGLELSPSPPLANEDIEADTNNIRYFAASNGEQMNMEQLGVTSINPPHNVEYMTFAKRFYSFESVWPGESMSQKPKQLAEAGFYYTGLGDRVKCLSCGGAIKNFAGRRCDPYVEHAKWFPHCRDALLQLKGTTTIPSNKKGAIASVQDGELYPAEELPLPTKLCGICKQRRVSVLSLPCCHIFSCTLCAHLESYICLICNEPSHADISVAF
ncbi:hypothetical protein B566_EDAN015963 [Ephemera danica]|nr:hypothetical protein B566_EDAN015963 [Ephemera danica]